MKLAIVSAFPAALLVVVACGSSSPAVGEQEAQLACESASLLAVEVGADFSNGDAGALENLLGSMKRDAGAAATANSTYEALDARVDDLLDSQLEFFLGDARTVDPIADLAIVQAECQSLGFGS